MSASKTIILALAIAGSAFAKKAPPPPRPVGNEASFQESFSPVEVTIKSTGVGNEPEEAEADIPRVAIEFVLFRWADKIITTEDETRQAKRFLDEIYAHPDKYVTWKADKVTSTRHLPDDRYEVTRMIRIHKGMLTDFFVSKGVIASREDLAAGAGNPVIMVLPDSPKSKNPLDVLNANPLAKQTAGAIESYLTQRQYEVVSPRGQDELSSQIHNFGNLKSSNDDQAYLIALSTGADVYITYAGEVLQVAGGRKASLVVQSYETSTGRLLGTETGYSQTRPNTTDQVLTEEAVSDAIDKVLQRVHNYWKTDAVRGVQYKVVVQFNGNFTPERKQDLSDALDELMDKEFPEHKVNISTDKTEDFILWAPKDKFKGTGDISRTFRKKLEANAKVREVQKNRKLLILELVGG